MSIRKYSLLRCLQQSPLVLPRWHKAAAVAREVVAPVARAAERRGVPVAVAEQQAQPAEQRQAPPMRVQRLVAA